MTNSHQSKMCKERPADIQIGSAYVCDECSERLQKALREEGCIPEREPHRHRTKRIWLTNDIFEISDRYARHIRRTTGDVVEWHDVVRGCLDRALRRAMQGPDRQGPAES